MRGMSIKGFIIATALLWLGAPASAQQTVVPSDPKGNPESLTVGPDGSLYLGSQGAPIVYRAKPGEKTATPFIDLRAGGSQMLLGLLADPAANRLWVCEIVAMDRSQPIIRATGILRAFDLPSGAERGRYPLPGNNNICNDMAVAPDRSLYLADTLNSRILRLAPGGTEFTTVLQNAALFGVDGIAFLNGVLYVNTVWSNNVYRIPIDATGKAGAPVQIYLSELLSAPDGMRVAGGKLIVADGGHGKVQSLKIVGDRATVSTLTSGLAFPTGVQPAGDVIWIADRAGNKAVSIPMPQ